LLVNLKQILNSLFCQCKDKHQGSLPIRESSPIAIFQYRNAINSNRSNRTDNANGALMTGQNAQKKRLPF